MKIKQKLNSKYIAFISAVLVVIACIGGSLAYFTSYDKVEENVHGVTIESAIDIIDSDLSTLPGNNTENKTEYNSVVRVKNTGTAPTYNELETIISVYDTEGNPVELDYNNLPFNIDGLTADTVWYNNMMFKYDVNLNAVKDIIHVDGLNTYQDLNIKITSNTDKDYLLKITFKNIPYYYYNHSQHGSYATNTLYKANETVGDIVSADDVDSSFYDKYVYSTNEDGTISMDGYLNKWDINTERNAIYIPSLYKGKVVTAIGRTLNKYSNTKKIYVPSTVNFIGDMFYNDDVVEDVYFRNYKSKTTFNYYKDSTKHHWPREVIVNDEGVLQELVGYEDDTEIDLREYTNIVNIGSAFRGKTWEKVYLPSTMVTFPSWLTYPLQGCSSTFYMSNNKSQVTFENSWDYGFTGSIVWPKEVIVDENGVLTELVGFDDDTEIDLREYTNIKKIGDYMFAGKKYTDIYLPTSTVEFGEYAFANHTTSTVHMGCKKSEFKKYGFAWNNYFEGSLVWQDEIIINSEGTLVEIVGYTDVTVLDLSSYTNLINTGTGLQNKKYETIILPDTLKKIGDYGFQYTSSQIIIKAKKSQVTLGSSYNYQFTGSIVWPKEVIVDSNGTLQELVNFDTTEEVLDLREYTNIKAIKDYGFASSTYKTIYLPSSITSIGDWAFKYSTATVYMGAKKSQVSCSSYWLNYFQGTIVWPKDLVYDSNGYLKEILGYDDETDVDLSEFTDMKGLNARIFADKKWKTLILPSSITYIGNYAFNNITTTITMKSKMSQITFDSYWYNNFKGAINWPQDVVVNSSGVLTSIIGFTDDDTLDLSSYTNIKSLMTAGEYGNNTFWTNSTSNTWKTIIMPNTISYVGSRAFQDCKASKIIFTAHKLSNSTNYLSYRGFSGEFVWPDDATLVDGVLTYDKDVTVISTKSIINSTETTTKGNTSINKVIISSTLTSVDSNAFNSDMSIYTNNEATYNLLVSAGYTNVTLITTVDSLDDIKAIDVYNTDDLATDYSVDGVVYSIVGDKNNGYAITKDGSIIYIYNNDNIDIYNFNYPIASIDVADNKKVVAKGKSYNISLEDLKTMDVYNKTSPITDITIDGVDYRLCGKASTGYYLVNVNNKNVVYIYQTDTINDYYISVNDATTIDSAEFTKIKNIYKVSSFSIKYEAEDYVSNCIENNSYATNGKSTYGSPSFPLTVSMDMSVTLKVHATSNDSGRPYNIVVDGNVVASDSVYTGGWNNWKDFEYTFDLTAGSHTIQILKTASYNPNIDYVVFEGETIGKWVNSLDDVKSIDIYNEKFFSTYTFDGVEYAIKGNATNGYFLINETDKKVIYIYPSDTLEKYVLDLDDGYTIDEGAYENIGDKEIYKPTDGETIKLEAESFATSSIFTNANFSGGSGTDADLEFTVDADFDYDTTLTIYTCAGDSTRAYNLIVNGEKVLTQAVNNGQWWSPAPVTHTIHLSKGTNTIRLKNAATKNPHFDYFLVSTKQLTKLK